MPHRAVAGIARHGELDGRERLVEEALLRVEDRKVVVDAQRGRGPGEAAFEQPRRLFEPPLAHQRLDAVENLLLSHRRILRQKKERAVACPLFPESTEDQL